MFTITANAFTWIKSLCNFYSLNPHMPSLLLLFKLSKLLNSLRIKRMCALHLSVTYNVMSDVLASFQTKTLSLHGNLARRREKRRSFTGPKPLNDLRDGRNFGIFLTFIQWTSAPSLCSSCVCDLQCFSPSPLSALMWAALLPVDIYSHWCTSIRKKVHWRRYQ